MFADYRVRALIALIRATGEQQTLEGLHHAIESEIAKRIKAIEDAHASGGKDFADAITDDECDQIEELLGLAFVASQSFITAVRTRWTKIEPIGSQQYNVRFRFAFGRSGFGLFKEAPLLSSDLECSVIEAINAVANYWKHSDEWPTALVLNGEWRKPTWDLNSMQNNARRTAEIVSALGMSPGSTGNLRQAASSLGVSNYSDLVAVRKPLFEWAEHLYETGKVDIERAVAAGNKR